MPCPRSTALALALALALAAVSFSVEAAPAATSQPRGVAGWVARVRARVHLPEKIARPLRLGICRVRGACTLAADRLEEKLPALLSRSFHRIRLVNPLALPAFAGQKVAEDPIFLTGFGIASTVIQHLEIPAMIALGVNPGLAFAIHEITETPINLAVIGWRQHHLRKDRSQSFLGTLRSLGRDYRAFVEERQGENRRFMAARARVATGSLPALAATLP